MAKKNNTNFIDSLNIGLMLLALIPAMLLPFELFLFVYAILGPLHYLTEINWLHKKQYFTKNKYDSLFMFLFIGIVVGLALSGSVWRYYSPLLIFIVFSATFGFVFFDNIVKKMLFATLCSVVGYLLFTAFYHNFRVIFSTLLPTIVHVFIFTGIFIVLGSLKSKSKLGVASVIVFLACASVTLFAKAEFNYAGVSEYIAENHSHFKRTNKVLIHFFDAIHTEEIKIDFRAPSRFTEGDIPVYFSETGIRVMRFIAFAYTYHYLNWFSKTSVIQWHDTKKRNIIIIVTIWILSVSLYSYDYRTGLKWLYILSFAHVVLEFPLNHLSFLEIKKQLLQIRFR